MCRRYFAKDFFLFVAVTGISFLLSAGQLSAAEGDLDPSFDVDGKVLTDFGSNDDLTHGAAIQSDQKIVVAGYARAASF